MSSQCKRKHKTLTLVEKNEIIRKLEKGEKYVNLTNEYGVGRATIHDIKKNSDKIKTFFKDTENMKSARKTLKSGRFPQVDDSLYAWFLQERKRHTPISGEILMEKAKFFYKQIMKNDDFQASEGWLQKFKRRFGIRLCTLKGEKLSFDDAAVEPYKEKFKNIIEEMDLSPDQVYTVGESGLFWRLLPKQTFVHSAEASALGGHMAKDRITFMPCSNASGTHKLDLLVIGKAKNPREFKNVNLPVVYKNQSRAWMTKPVFTEWFHESFIPSVKKFLKKRRLPQKALLVLDNCPEHPGEDNLRSKDGFVRVMFLSPNVTPLLQPMDQNIIQRVKLHYRKSLLYKVLSKEESVVQSLKDTNIKDVVFYIANAWENLTKETLVCSWEKLWPELPLLEAYKNSDSAQEESLNFANQPKVDPELFEIRDTIDEILVDKSDVLTLDDVNSWVVGDEDENNQFMTDDEIIQDVQSKKEDQGDEESAAVHTVSHGNAMDAFATSIKWAEENGVAACDILTLLRLQEQAFKMSFKAKKQRTITSVFIKME